MTTKTLRPFEYLGSKEYPQGLFDGHDLSLAGHTVIYALGSTAKNCISNFCFARGIEFDEMTLRDKLECDENFDWGYRWKSDSTSMKSGGVIIDNIYIMTWWK